MTTFHTRAFKNPFPDHTTSTRFLFLDKSVYNRSLIQPEPLHKNARHRAMLVIKFLVELASSSVALGHTHFLRTVPLLLERPVIE